MAEVEDDEVVMYVNSEVSLGRLRIVEGENIEHIICNTEMAKGHRYNTIFNEMNIQISIQFLEV